MELNFGSWLKHKWNAFLDRNPYSYRADVGPGYTYLFLGAPAPLFSLPFSARGEGFGKGNLVALSSFAEVWNPLQKVRPNKKPCILKC